MSRDDERVSRFACVVVAGLFVAGLLQLGVCLKAVQVDGAADYNYASARQSVRRVQVGGSRGNIFDRNGETLAGNRLSVSIVCQPAAFQRRGWDATVAEIGKAIEDVAKTVGRASPVSEKDIRRHVRQSLAMPLFVWSDIGEEELSRFAEHERDLPGFAVVETEERTYPNGSLAAHLLGYVGRERGDAEAGDEKFNFVVPEMRGRAGIEMYYDSFLRGVPGENKLLVDACGYTIREWTVSEPSQGPDLQLSIDIRIQREVERQLAGECGACAVLDPRTGEILALASAPGFNPNEFVPVLRTDLYNRLAADPAKPLLNRASGGAYAPGSTFKPITALAGLMSGHSPEDAYSCCGVFAFGSMHLHCASRWGHGELDMRHALMKSCNPYFCNLGHSVGTNALIRVARAFGLGSKTGVDLGVDMAGTVPDGEWKMRTYGERWYPGDLVQMSIGQGMLLVSPLQMARVAGAIGTGYHTVPHLKRDMPVERRPLPVPKEHLDVVREGMRMVVAGDGTSKGTGWRGGEGVRVPVSGKTGTAEIGKGSTRRKNTWFMAYAPSEQPSVAIAMVIENGDSGGGTTAPRVGNILRAVFDEQ